MKKVTNRDHSHPHHRLTDHLQCTRIALRSLSNKGLNQIIYKALELAAHDGLLPKVEPDNYLQHRHQMIGFLAAREEMIFRQRWLEYYGWPFDDCYIPEKYVEHLKTAHLRNQQAQASIGLQAGPEPDGTNSSEAVG